MYSFIASRDLNVTAKYQGDNSGENPGEQGGQEGTDQGTNSESSGSNSEGSGSNTDGSGSNSEGSGSNSESSGSNSTGFFAIWFPMMGDLIILPVCVGRIAPSSIYIMEFLKKLSHKYCAGASSRWAVLVVAHLKVRP